MAGAPEHATAASSVIHPFTLSGVGANPWMLLSYEYGGIGARPGCHEASPRQLEAAVGGAGMEALTETLAPLVKQIDGANGGETWTAGMDDLKERCEKYYQQGARFAKSRRAAVIG